MINDNFAKWPCGHNKHLDEIIHTCNGVKIGIGNNFRMPDEIFKAGDMVEIRKGATIFYRGEKSISKRAIRVLIDHTLRREPMDGTGRPTVVWAGSGGYWREAFMDDCKRHNKKEYEK